MVYKLCQKIKNRGDGPHFLSDLYLKGDARFNFNRTLIMENYDEGTTGYAEVFENENYLWDRFTDIDLKSFDPPRAPEKTLSEQLMQIGLVCFLVNSLEVTQCRFFFRFASERQLKLFLNVLQVDHVKHL